MDVNLQANPARLAGVELFSRLRVVRLLICTPRLADSEIREQRWLAISTDAIEVPTHQVGGLLICRNEYVVGSDSPDREKAISPVPNCPSMNLKTRLGGRHRRESRQEQKVEQLDTHELSMDELNTGEIMWNIEQD